MHFETNYEGMVTPPMIGPGPCDSSFWKCVSSTSGRVWADGLGFLNHVRLRADCTEEGLMKADRNIPSQGYSSLA